MLYCKQSAWTIHADNLVAPTWGHGNHREVEDRKIQMRPICVKIFKSVLIYGLKYISFRVIIFFSISIQQ